MGTWLVVISAVCGCTLLYAICIQTRGVSVQSIEQPCARNKTVKTAHNYTISVTVKSCYFLLRAKLRAIGKRDAQLINAALFACVHLQADSSCLLAVFSLAMADGLMSDVRLEIAVAADSTAALTTFTLNDSRPQPELVSRILDTVICLQICLLFYKS